jgi:hypothetical protein
MKTCPSIVVDWKGRGFHSQLGNLIFQFSYSSIRTMALGFTQHLTEMRTRFLEG